MYRNIDRITRWLCLLLVFALPSEAAAADKADYSVDVDIPYGLNHDPALRKKVQKNAAAILTAMNMAADLGKGINYSGIDITQEAKAALNNLWAGKKIVYASFDEDFNTPVR